MSDIVELPSDADDWSSVDLSAEGWSREHLDALLMMGEACGSSALLLLHHGRIVVEDYWKVHPEDLDPDRRAAMERLHLGTDRLGRSIEDVGAVQNSICAVLLAIARDRGIIDFNHPVQEYLGPGWSGASLDQEREIAIWHLMSMTSGLTRELEYEAAAGVTWSYNPVAYQLLIRVLAQESGLDPDAMLRGWMAEQIGLQDSRWVARSWSGSESAIGLASTARDLGRFALLIQNRGRWRDTEVVSADALDELLNPSQTMNPAFGLLWWLNASDAHRVPSRTELMPGPLLPTAPRDLVFGYGAADTQVAVSWGQDLSLIRLGVPMIGPSDTFASLWRHIEAARPG